ncbi:MAG: hypothetical protein Q7T51_01875 [Candidatus Moranbacteria bacterium]|nr:hypothetical protein [Candidatus Moranbacteria bacterium]
MREGQLIGGNMFPRLVTGILENWDRIEVKVERMETLMKGC